MLPGRLEICFRYSWILHCEYYWFRRFKSDNFSKLLYIHSLDFLNKFTTQLAGKQVTLCDALVDHQMSNNYKLWPNIFTLYILNLRYERMFVIKGSWWIFIFFRGRQVEFKEQGTTNFPFFICVCPTSLSFQFCVMLWCFVWPSLPPCDSLWCQTGLTLQKYAMWLFII